MALQKTTLHKGIECNYWKIIKIESVALSNRTYFDIALYYTQATREENPQNYVQVLQLNTEGADMTREDVYEYLKTLPEFEGAITI